jgi:hypothetical protein
MDCREEGNVAVFNFHSEQHINKRKIKVLIKYILSPAKLADFRKIKTQALLCQEQSL